MKKMFALILAVAMTVTLAACSADEKDKESQTTTTAPVESVASDALEILTKVWGTYTEEESFPVIGGDIDNQANNAPGKYSLTDAEGINSTLGLPQDSIAMVDDAASLMHMMNANTFTCGAFRVTDSANLKAVEDSLKANIMGRQWMCGFPDTLIIAGVGDNFVVSAFGNAEIIETFKTKLLAQYGTQASVVYEENLAF